MKLLVCRSFLMAAVLFLGCRLFVGIWLSDQGSNVDIHKKAALSSPMPTIEVYKGNQADGETDHVGSNTTDDRLAVKKTASEHARPSSILVNKTSRSDGATYFTGSNIPDDMLAMKRPDYLPDFKNPCWYVTSESSPVKKLRCLPYFHIIGVDKSGTTDLWFRVTAHPDIRKPDAILDKETHWWSWRRFGFDIWINSLKILHFDSYLQNFDLPAEIINRTVSTLGNRTYHHLVTGEGSPTLFWDFTGWNLIPQNKNRSVEQAYLTPHCIKHLTPDAKLIVIFRNPTERLYSDYLFLDDFKKHRKAFASAAGFHRDVLKSISMLEDCFSRRPQLECLYNKQLHMLMPTRVIVGMYDIFLKQWLKVFPRNQILILRNEDYSRDIKSHIKRVYDFLQLRSLSESELDSIQRMPRVFEKTDHAKEAGPMMPETRLILDKFYSKYNKLLAETLGDPKYLWDSNN